MAFASLFVCGMAVFCAGCGTGPTAEFKYRESTEDLISDAKKAVHKTLKDDFGTPSDLVAWERFPIAYGGVKGVVASVENKAVVVTIDGETSKVREAAPLLWLTGSLSGEKTGLTSVTSFAADTNHMQFAGAGSPAVGDRFIVGFGQDLQLGRQVYMKNCLHCHGVSGDGAGPTGQFLNPRPRDYRNGQFKFTSTKSGEKATREDLDRIVKYGIPGTYMPSFLLLGERETKSVVEYVRWLAIRGEFEKRLVAEMTSDYAQASIADAVEKANIAYAEKKKRNETAEKPVNLGKAKNNAASEFVKYAKDELPGAIDETANLLAEAWGRAEELESVVRPSVQRVEDTPESRERGRLLYMSDTTKCYTCHGFTGRGDGGATEDFWPKPGSKETWPKRGLHDDWGNPLKPRNLTLGQYRGGRRPIDIFRRIYVGIKGTPMPAFGGNKIKDEQIWDIVNFAMSLPYAPPSKPPETSGHVAKTEEKAAH